MKKNVFIQRCSMLMLMLGILLFVIGLMSDDQILSPLAECAGVFGFLMYIKLKSD